MNQWWKQCLLCYYTHKSACVCSQLYTLVYDFSFNLACLVKKKKPMLNAVSRTEQLLVSKSLLLLKYATVTLYTNTHMLPNLTSSVHFFLLHLL